MGVLKNWRVSIGVGACAIAVSGCGTSTGSVAEPATPEPTAERPPPLDCKQHNQMVLDHFGLGKGADSPEEAAAPFQDPGSTLVVDETGGAATIHVVSADGHETLAIMRASILRGWRIDTIESCADYVPQIVKR